MIGTSFHEILLITFIVLGLTKWGCSKFFITQMGVDQLFRAGYAHLVLGVSPIGGPVQMGVIQLGVSPNEGSKNGFRGDAGKKRYFFWELYIYTNHLNMI